MSTLSYPQKARPRRAALTVVGAALILFVIIHVAMVIATGFRNQLRVMTWGQ